MKVQSRQKHAELIAGLGAVILGMGIGAMPILHLENRAAWFVVAGAILHGWGMFDKRRLEKQADVPPPTWSTATYWLCWLLLAALVMYTFLHLR